MRKAMLQGYQRKSPPVVAGGLALFMGSSEGAQGHPPKKSPRMASDLLVMAGRSAAARL